MSHVVTVPDYIWEWAQRETGFIKPTTFLRNCLSQAMIDHIQQDAAEPVAPVDEKDDFKARWNLLNMVPDNFDERFTLARKAWIEAHGSEKLALEWIEKAVRERNMQNPRAFVIGWHKENGSK